MYYATTAQNPLTSRRTYAPTMQSTSHIVMIRPATFRKNEETAANNLYQREISGLSPSDLLDQALSEFDGFVEALRDRGVNVHVVEADPDVDAPDALFPNNWVSFHEDGRIGLYPMYATNRRAERREDLIYDLELRGFDVDEVVDFTEFEEHDKFLEGTGSMVLDRVHKRAYAALSERTELEALKAFCEAFDFEGIPFTANQDGPHGRHPIYHTNVMMSIGTRFAAGCWESIDDEEERAMVKETLAADGKVLVDLSEDQINHFAGNMLEVQSASGDPVIAMSTQAFEALSATQIDALSSFGEIVHAPLNTIEACGGGSARCMLAENFLPTSNQ